MSRRAFLRLIPTLFAFGLSSLADEGSRPGIYQKDVDFLLAELPKQASRFFAIKKIDWDAVTRQFREEAQKIQTDADHLKLCNRLIARLRDGHAGLIDSKIKWPDESNGRAWTGPRVLLLTVGNDVFVRSAFGEAASQGVKAGSRVVSIDGKPSREWLDKKIAEMSDQRGFSTEQQALYSACHGGLADWAGSAITFELIDPDGTEKGIRLTRNGGPNYAPIGPVFAPKGLKAFDRNACGKTSKGFGYIHLRKIPGNLDVQLDQMLAEIGNVPGLILDMRGNSGGGCDHEAVFGKFLANGARWGQYTGKGPHTFTGPMVVILDAGVCSAGETVGGMFKEDGRAYAIGDSATAGMSSSKQKLPVPSGLFTAYYSVFSNKARFNKGRGIEGVGVPPHELVPYDPKDLAAGIDTQIRRAEELLSKGFPERVVPYMPPSPSAEPASTGQ